MNKLKRVVAGCVATMIVAIGLTGCSTAKTVNHNLSKEANEFGVYRRITVTNARTDTVMMQAEGYMSLDNDDENELVVTIKTGEDKYYKNYVYLNKYTCYVVEQTEVNSVDKYHYEWTFYPSRIIPDIDAE